MQNQYENVIVSPTPTNQPIINARLRTVNIRIKDTLEPNTTYSINFGNGIKDVNEGNVSKNFTYVFSTGRNIDENTLTGKVIMAETGGVDSTLIVVLHRNLDDSAVAKEKPRYITRLDGKGNFEFNFLAPGTYALYAIPNDFSHHYDDTTKPFAFADQPIQISDSVRPITLYAYQLPKTDTAATKKAPAPPPSGKNNKQEKKQLRLNTNLDGKEQDLLKNLEITFSEPITKFDSTKLTLADNDLKPLGNYLLVPDTSKTKFTFQYKWLPGTSYNLVIDKNAFADSAGVTLAKNDTIAFTTKAEEDYGSVRLRFNNLDYSKNPVLQIILSEKIVESVPLTDREWYRKLFPPGDYDLRILYDRNKNGLYDPGSFFGVHRQPEIVIPLATKLSVRANWDNEKDITL